MFARICYSTGTRYGNSEPARIYKMNVSRVLGTHDLLVSFTYENPARAMGVGDLAGLTVTASFQLPLAEAHALAHAILAQASAQRVEPIVMSVNETENSDLLGRAA